MRELENRMRICANSNTNVVEGEFENETLCHINRIEENISWKDVKKQTNHTYSPCSKYKTMIVCSNIALMWVAHAGINLTFSNLLLNELDVDTSSWFASIIGLTTPIGAYICGPVIDKYGRKLLNLLIAIPCVSSWILMSLASPKNPILLYSARFLGGVAGGLTTAAMIYVSEISHKQYRSVLLSLLSVYFSFGILLTTIMQYFLYWRIAAVCNVIVFALLYALASFICIESPIWLLSFKSDWDEAKRTLHKLLPNQKFFEEEWIRLNEKVRSNSKTSQNLKNYRISSPIIYKPFCFLILLSLLQQLTGIYVVVLYAIKLFPSISPKLGSVMSNEAFVLFGILRFVTSFVSSAMSIKIGRKPLLISSSAGMGVSNLFLAISTALLCSRETSSYQLPSNWTNLCDSLSILSFLMCICFGTFGVMSIPWTLTVELLPTKIRSVGSSIIVSYSYILMFVFGKIFPFVLDNVNVSYIFSFFSFICFVLCVFVWFFIPETLGKNFDEIEAHYQKKESKSSNQ